MENQKLPNATTSLILGILSIISSCCYGIIGLPLGIIAIVLGNKAIKIDKANPNEYAGRSNANTGKILGIIGVILSVLVIITIVGVIAYFGIETLQNPELLEQRMQELQ